jgi:cyclase
VRNNGLVKTQRFSDGKYVGDPINAVRIFNEKEVDEIVVLDIDATATGREPDYSLIRRLAAECRMPLCYGGGVKTAAQFEAIVALGVEKVAISSAAIETPDLVSAAAAKVGSQSVVVVIDAKKGRGGYAVWTRNGTVATRLSVEDCSARMQSLGAGEIVVNSIDHDGVMKGYDLDLVGRVRRATTLPMTALGGAGSHSDIGCLLETFGVLGAGAGSLFVFKGVYRAVLISYPSRAERDGLYVRAHPRT